MWWLYSELLVLMVLAFAVGAVLGALALRVVVRAREPEPETAADVREFS